MSKGLSRDALIEAAESALIATPGRAVLSADGVAKVPVESFAAIATDAVLRAVADDLEAQSEPHWDAWMKSEGLAAHRHAQTWTTYAAAAERVRDLLGKDKTNE